MKNVYTLADLESRELLDADADKPARLAVIGHPIAHSASPIMHQAALDARSIDARYIRIDLDPGRVVEALSKMRKLGFIGCNVTVPHKIEAMAACGEIDPAARKIGAVNTLRFNAGGVEGFNTDGPGFQRAVEEVFDNRLRDLRVMVVGAGGGAGQAIATQCALTGVPRLVLANRTRAKVDELAARLQPLLPVLAMALDDPNLSLQCADCDLIVNTSSLGLQPGDPSILPATYLNERHLVYDTIYKPPLTPLLQAASQSGARIANGLSMLIHQGALAFSLWFPGEDPLPEMRAAMAHLAGG